MHELSKKKVIAITGTIGSGKSKVSSILSKKYPVIDCDKINAKLLQKGEEGYNCLIQLPWIELDEKGEIDKKKMASKIFLNQNLKNDVENILHPLIFKKIEEWIKKQNSDLIFVEVPLLFEIQAQDRFDEVWCIVCDLDKALYRLQTYRNFTKEDAEARIHNQLDVDYKKKYSDVVIENNESIEELEKEIEKILKR